MGWKMDCRKAAKALTREKRQQIMDLLHAGKTIGEARAEADVSPDEITGVIRMNTITHTWEELRKVSL